MAQPNTLRMYTPQGSQSSLHKEGLSQGQHMNHLKRGAKIQTQKIPQERGFLDKHKDFLKREDTTKHKSFFKREVFTINTKASP